MGRVQVCICAGVSASVAGGMGSIEINGKMCILEDVGVGVVNTINHTHTLVCFMYKNFNNKRDYFNPLIKNKSIRLLMRFYIMTLSRSTQLHP